MKIVEIIGGLGNQMFQYAFHLAVRDAAGGKGVAIHTRRFRETSDNMGYQLDQVFGVQAPEADPTLVDRLIARRTSLFTRGIQKVLPGWRGYFCEQKFRFDPRVLPLARRGTMYFRGLWQDENYFAGKLAAQVREAFRFSIPENAATSAIRHEMEGVQAVCLHVRRGDYVSNPKYASILGGVCTDDYYAGAIAEIERRVADPVYFVFSDDVDWVLANSAFLQGRRIHPVRGNSGRESALDMKLMSVCRHNIIANSSFSWWGAWLNPHPDKVAVGPAKWFRNDPRLEDNHIVPDSWLKV